MREFRVAFHHTGADRDSVVFARLAHRCEGRRGRADPAAGSGCCGWQAVANDKSWMPRGQTGDLSGPGLQAPCQATCDVVVLAGFRRKASAEIVEMARSGYKPKSVTVRLTGLGQSAVGKKKEPATTRVTSSFLDLRKRLLTEGPAHPPKLRRGGARRGRRSRSRGRSSVGRGGLGLGSAGGQPHQADHDESNYRLHWILLFLEGSAHLARSGMVCRPFRRVKSSIHGVAKCSVHGGLKWPVGMRMLPRTFLPGAKLGQFVVATGTEEDRS